MNWNLIEACIWGAVSLALMFAIAYVVVSALEQMDGEVEQ